MQNGFESQTTESLEQYGIVEGSENNVALSRFAKLACEIFNVSTAAIMVVEEELVWPLTCCGPEVNTASIPVRNLYKKVVESKDIYIIDNASVNEGALDFNEANSTAGLRFYAGYPLRTKSGFIIGVFSLAHEKARLFSESEKTQFSLLGSLLIDHFEKQHEQYALAAENKAKIRALAHDLKNPLTIVTLQAELLMDENNASDDIIEMSQQISVAGRKINDIINKRLFS